MKRVWLSLLMLVVLVTVVRGQADSPSLEVPETDSAAAPREVTLQQMRELANNTTIATLSGDASPPLEMVANPLMRYADPPRGTLDATLWCFSTSGRPSALLKIESREGRWINGVTSLSPDLIETRWDGQQSFRTTSPGLVLQPLGDAPAAARSEAGRLRQMKQLASRFSATFVNRVGREQMRLLPRPLRRFADPETGLLDGAIFALTSTGTNPNALLLIELHEAANAPTWKFGLARMTIGQLVVRLDSTVVWEVPPITAKRGEVSSDTYGSVMISKE